MTRFLLLSSGPAIYAEGPGMCADVPEVRQHGPVFCTDPFCTLVGQQQTSQQLCIAVPLHLSLSYTGRSNCSPATPDTGDPQYDPTPKYCVLSTSLVSSVGRQNTPTNGQNTAVSAQAKFRASRPNSGPIRTDKGSIHRTAQRSYPYSTQTNIKAVPPELPIVVKSYRIEIVQHPVSSAEFGDATLSRLPLAPPLIARLLVPDQADGSAVDDTDLPFLVAQVSLLSGHEPVLNDVFVGPGGHTTTQRLLYGNLVSSPHILRNLQGRQGVYFLFPDVSVRRRGQYQLSVTLLSLPRSGISDLAACANSGESGVVLAHARSLPFDVLPRENYVAPAQTPLTQYFVQQGARMYAFETVVPSASYYRG